MGNTGDGVFSGGRLPSLSLEPLTDCRRKVRMTASHHVSYALGDTRATIARTKDGDPAMAATRVHEAGMTSNRRSEIWSRIKVAILEGAARSPPVQGELMLVGCFCLTLLHNPTKKKGSTSELNLEIEDFFRFSTSVPLIIVSCAWAVRALSHMDSSMCPSGKEEGGKNHTWRSQYNGELYAAFGKDESLPKRNLLILSQLVGPVPSCEISGEEDQVGPCEQLDALSPSNLLSEMRQMKRKENPWTKPIISTP
uniref:Uncharacterized protein n=1 Tax=Solanum lycopersicum TaxID=4081 RepID=A0A3Q7EBS6_SOLLC